MILLFRLKFRKNEESFVYKVEMVFFFFLANLFWGGGEKLLRVLVYYFGFFRISVEFCEYLRVFGKIIG